MKRFLWFLFWMLCATRVWAQPAPVIVTSVQTTNTANNSVAVGCAIGSTTCTGGIQSGPISASLISLSSGYVEIQPFSPSSCTNRLVNLSGTLQWNCNTLAVGGSISGTTGTIPIFTASNAIGNSIMTSSGTTVTVANTLNATSLGGLLTTGNQTGLTGTGTITSGTWNATPIGLAYGGTNANLSGTGGTSQFLEQNTLGGNITVVRPQVSDLSNGSSVCLVSSNCIFTGASYVQFTTSTTGAPAGSISKNPTFGLWIQGTTGSTYDFGLIQPSGLAPAILAVPTGTANVSFGGSINVTGTGQSQFASANAIEESILVRNTQAGATAGTDITLGNDVVAQRALLQLPSSTYTGVGGWADTFVLRSAGSGGTIITAEAGGGNIRFSTGGTTNYRWGIDNVGDLTFGASSHIALSNGAPTTSTPGATISGSDYAFLIGVPTSTGSIAVTLGHAFSNPPVCVAIGTNPSASYTGFVVGYQYVGGGNTLTFLMSPVANATQINVHCMGY